MGYDGNAKALLIVVLAHIITHARVIAPSSSVEKNAIQIAAIIRIGIAAHQYDMHLHSKVSRGSQ